MTGNEVQNTCAHINLRRMLPVVLQGAEDGLRDRRRSGDVGALGMEAVLVSGVGEGHLLAVGGAVGEASFGGDREALRTGGAGRTTLVRRYARWCVVAERMLPVECILTE